MTAPAYHLRTNKATDRLALMEAIRRLSYLGTDGLKEYTYCGLGGDYLEDFRLLYELFPEIGMISIEEDVNVFERQKFHTPCSSLNLVRKTMSSFVTGYDPGNTKSIFWTDYSRLEPICFEDFQCILTTVADDSMIKITLPARPTDFWDPNKRKLNKSGKTFRDDYGAFMPNAYSKPPRTRASFASLLQDMVRIASQEILPAETNGRKFIPVSSFYYSDGTPMFTLTGVVCKESKRDKLEQAFRDWELANLTWNPPKQIDVPILSTKERLRLQPLLPSETSGEVLREKLGHLINDNCKSTEKSLTQYAALHRYMPYFLKGVP